MAGNGGIIGPVNTVSTACQAEVITYKTASGSLTQRLANDFQQKLRAARIADGQENPPQNIMPAGRLIEAHLNGSTTNRFRHEQS